MTLDKHDSLLMETSTLGVIGTVDRYIAVGKDIGVEQLACEPITNEVRRHTFRYGG